MSHLQGIVLRILLLSRFNLHGNPVHHVASFLIERLNGACELAFDAIDKRSNHFSSVVMCMCMQPVPATHFKIIIENV